MDPPPSYSAIYPDKVNTSSQNKQSSDVIIPTISTEVQRSESRATQLQTRDCSGTFEEDERPTVQWTLSNSTYACFFSALLPIVFALIFCLCAGALLLQEQTLRSVSFQISAIFLVLANVFCGHEVARKTWRGLWVGLAIGTIWLIIVVTVAVFV